MKLQTYAAYYDNDLRIQSSSGGIFSLLASNFEIVYGVAMTDDCYGAHFVRTEGDLSALRGSKYLQATVGDTYKNVKRDLEAGKSVLFSGTGCQVNGLKLFLGKEYENLFCIDIICHGVPSPTLWEMYVKHQEQVRGEKIKTVNFRCKDQGWADFGMKENDVFSSKDVDPYMLMFLRNYCLRPSCYVCKAKGNYQSDLSLADFWGIETVAPEMNDNKGISLVIVRTEKAAELFEKIKNLLQCKAVSYEDAVKHNSAEYRSASRPQQRDTFFVDMQALSFEKLSRNYLNPSSRIKAKRKIQKILAKFIKKIGKK